MDDDIQRRVDTGSRDSFRGLEAVMTAASAIHPSPSADGGVYAALDLGTNNCRLLIASPTGGSFRVIDSFSRIVRLGEGILSTGRISEAAIERTIAALVM